MRGVGAGIRGQKDQEFSLKPDNGQIQVGGRSIRQSCYRRHPKAK